MHLSNYLDTIDRTNYNDYSSHGGNTEDRYIQLNGLPSCHHENGSIGVYSTTCTRLYDYDDVPQFLQGNHYIRKGYRVYLTTELCYKSLFSWNNETLNMWTHLVGFLIFFTMMIYDNIFLLPQLNATFSDHLVITIGLLCFQVCMVFSTGYHMFRCCSPQMDKQWFAYDLTGISVGILGCYIPGVHYAFICLPLWKDLYMMIVSVLFLSVLMCQTQPRYYSDAWTLRRSALYIGLVLYGVIPTLHWIYLHGGLHSQIVEIFGPRVFIVYILGMTAFFFYVTMMPERCCPGCFDYIGASHQIWHIIILATFLWWHDSGLDLLEYRKHYPCLPTQ